MKAVYQRNSGEAIPLESGRCKATRRTLDIASSICHDSSMFIQPIKNILTFNIDSARIYVGYS